MNTDGGLLNVEGRSRPLVVWGFVIAHPNGTILYERSEVVEEEGTNNEAGYLGVIHGLRAARDLGATVVRLRVDSQMVARQLEGAYAVKAENIRSYFKTARRLARGFDTFIVEWVRRENNGRADSLCHQAMHLWRHQRGIDYKSKNSAGKKQRARARKAKQA